MTVCMFQMFASDCLMYLFYVSQSFLNVCLTALSLRFTIQMIVCICCIDFFFIDSFTFIEMKKMSVFKHYEPGEPTCRLYVKNVAKQVEEKVSVCSTDKNKKSSSK